MSHGEQRDWAGTTAAVAAPPPKSGAGTVAALRTAMSADGIHGAAAQWELLCRGASPAQQADLLTLASQQGLLYSHQLPETPAARSQAQIDEPRNFNVLGKILSGQVSQLEPVRPAPITIVDEALDDVQRYAVAVALTTPDLCLIQGLPGTGKSRVIAEIVTQAAKRGDRVLLVAAHCSALDRVLEDIAQRDCLCPLRCLAPEEHIEQLTPRVRALTLQERSQTIRHQAVRTARATRDAAELQCARRRHQEPIWPQLRELAAALTSARADVAHLETKLAAVAAEVAQETDAGVGRLGKDLQAFQRAGQAQLAQLATAITAVEQERDQHTTKRADLDRQIAVIEPMAAAKLRNRWWTWTWWKATFQGNVASKLAELQSQWQVTQAAIDAANTQWQALTEKRLASEQATAANIQTRLQTEMDSRRYKLSAVIDHHQAEIGRNEALWGELCCQLEPAALQPAARTADAVEASEISWLRHRQDDEARCQFAREWATLLENSCDAVAARLPGYANLVAATPAALAADAHFSDPAATGGQFDLLVVEDADQLSESEFLKAARHAHQWVLVGEPPLLGELVQPSSPRPSALRPGGPGRGPCFHQLWSSLHCDTSTLPYAWFREGQRLGCRLRHVAPEQRQWLENEPLADAPDVELRILALPRARPELAEVLFPETMQLPTAKGFLFRELQEITVQTASRGLRWSETPQCLELHFTRTPAGAGAVTLDNGVREYLMGPNLDHTSKLEFERAAGWDRSAVELWIDQHLHLRDLCRTVWLEESYRMAPTLADVVFDLLGGASCGYHVAWREAVEPVVHFVPVQGTGKHKGNGRGTRRPEPSTSQLGTTGAGLETDLASIRPGDRLVAEMRGLVPGRGFVNIQEARAVVRKLEELQRQAPPAGDAAATIAVVTLCPTQAELIRQLILQSPGLSAHAASIPVGPPTVFRHREADVVLVSLTRSHSHRAVAYAEGPAAWLLALTRARRRLILFGDPGNLVRRGQWRGALDHLDEAAASREAQLIGQLVRYLQGLGRHQQAFRMWEGTAT